MNTNISALDFNSIKKDSIATKITEESLSITFDYEDYENYHDVLKKVEIGFYKENPTQEQSLKKGFHGLVTKRLAHSLKGVYLLLSNLGFEFDSAIDLKKLANTFCLVKVYETFKPNSESENKETKLTVPKASVEVEDIKTYLSNLMGKPVTSYSDNFKSSTVFDKNIYLKCDNKKLALLGLLLPAENVTLDKVFCNVENNNLSYFFGFKLAQDFNGFCDILEKALGIDLSEISVERLVVLYYKTVFDINCDYKPSEKETERIDKMNFK